MAIDAAFWVAISFFIFLGILIYFKIHQKVKSVLDENILSIKNQINEAEKLKEEAKNILSEQEYLKEKQKFLKKDEDYKLTRSKTINNTSQMKIKAQKTLITSLTPILTEYAQKNSISYIIPKQNIIIGKIEFDLTKPILEILNSKIKNINLK